MNDFEAFIVAAARPMDILADFNRQAVVDAGMKSTLAADGEKAREVYFGPTKFSRKQAHAVRIARETGKSLDQILFIEQQVRTLGTEKEKWRIRLALLSVRGNYETLKRRAKDIVPEVDTPAPESAVRFGKERKGKRTFSATGDARDIAALEYALRQKLDANRPEGPQMYEAFHDLLHKDGAVADAVPRPLVQIPLPDYIKVLGGQGDETILGLSDGTTMTGAEYLMHHHSKDLEVALFHPQVGPVNLYSTKRFANKKQRDLARATLTTCPVPDCRHAADNCEVHHIEPWARGGPTNMNNLSVLCRYHNRTNDDDPGRHNRGRIQVRDGTPTWISPRGTPVANNTHQYGAMHLLFGT
ncbi:HNH endonuclease signature motif containing protein [Corynebacterium sp. p3-SID1194]|uniref:HNH endonuclease signature motif containing protein n=1 Tax=Corynebacterium sp. p3-SID1194 TaxID=2916105 RepID=UPI0021A93FFE|nr:HNH endonuclease signature motif containing protein [Corynebacterium sp. p3-SID1194]MCT1451141.1 HNH endonuclease [Corynebacterium sp. p3-SID1194]